MRGAQARGAGRAGCQARGGGLDRISGHIAEGLGGRGRGAAGRIGRGDGRGRGVAGGGRGQSLVQPSAVVVVDATHPRQQRLQPSFQVGDPCFADVGGTFCSGIITQISAGRDPNYRIRLDNEDEEESLHSWDLFFTQTTKSLQ